MHLLGVVPETTVECLYSAVVLETHDFLLSTRKRIIFDILSIGSSQKSCDLAARYTKMERKHIQLELDLKLVQENLTKAKEETKGMFGETSTTAFFPLFVSKSDLAVTCR